MKQTLRKGCFDRLQRETPTDAAAADGGPRDDGSAACCASRLRPLTDRLTCSAARSLVIASSLSRSFASANERDGRAWSISKGESERGW